MNLPPRKRREPLRPSEEAHILDLADAGQSQQAIANAMGCSQSTVSRTLIAFDDSRLLARRALNAGALVMAKRIVTEAQPRDALRALAKIDVVRDDDERAFVGIQVLIGGEQAPALEAGSIALEVIDATAIPRTDDEDPLT
jgi:hypothetical protein